MNHRLFFLPALLLLFSACTDKDKPSLAPVRPVTDSYFGMEVTDPYRYMENMYDTVFLNWMKEYAGYTRGILDRISGREQLVDWFLELDQRKTDQIYGLQIARTGRYFYLKLTPEDEVGKLYYRDSYEEDEHLLYDPESYDGGTGASYVIAGIRPDFNGERIAIAVAPNGSEQLTLIIMDVSSGKLLPDKISQVFGSVAWLRGGSGFIYGKANTDDIHDPSRLLDTKVYYHRLGSLQQEDQVVFSSEMYPEVGRRPEEIPRIIYDHYDNDYFLLLSTVERYFKLFRAEMDAFDPAARFSWQPLITREDQVQNFYTKGDDLYLYTAKNAPGFEILRTSKTMPDIPGAEVVVPAPEAGMISGFSFTSEAMYYKVKINGVQELLFRIPDGTDAVEQVKLPAKAGSLDIRTRQHHFDDIWISITGWTMDDRRYRFHASSGEFTPEPLSSAASFPEYDDLMVEELMVPSHDGVLVPLSVIYRKGLSMDGTAPVLLNGYGAYGISLTPYFNPYMLTWTLKGGIYAVAHVRGGGELGDAWRLAGHKATKPNTWKDFISCAEFLAAERYTSPKRLAIFGGSAGGILIGRALTERPDLFAAAIPLVGVMNPLRAEQSPNGPVNAPEFGTVKDSAECMALMEMDAYLNVEDDTDYPATLITAGFNDPRVIVWQPAKFAARLQAANGSGSPILFDVDYTSGHGVGDTKSKSFEDIADLVSFALWQTGHKEFELTE
jgi:prolyl oligopeptidase